MRGWGHLRLPRLLPMRERDIVPWSPGHWSLSRIPMMMVTRILRTEMMDTDWSLAHA